MPNLFFTTSAPLDLALMRQHDPWLVLLSVLVSVLASSMAMHLAALAGRMRHAMHRQAAVAVGALSLGCGIWAMHFIGMLAFPLCATGRFDLPLTLVSMVPSTAASWLALTLLARPRLGLGTLLGGGVLVGAGIGVMHYLGMMAAERASLIHYDPRWFALSLGVAVLLAVLALWIRWGLQAHAQRHPWGVTVLAGVVMGCAIAGMHYTGMAAVRLQGPVPLEALGQNHQAPLALGIAAVALLVGLLVMALNLMLRFRELFRTAQGNELRLRAMVDTAAEGIVMIDAQGTVQLYSGAAQRLLGWSAEDMLGQSIDRLIPEPHRARHDGYIRQFLQTGESPIIGSGREIQALHKDGRLVPIFVSVGQVRLPGTPLFVAFLSDLSQLRAMEQQELTLRNAKEQAEAVAQARSAFLAHMSHEIRTPMNAVLGFTEAVLDTPLTATQRRHLELAQQAARTLLRLLNDILDTSKLDKGAVTLEVADFAPHAVWAQLLASLQIAADRKGLRLRLDEGPEVPPYLRGDALRLQQIVLNLLGNAIKFTEHGSVVLQVRYAQGQLRVAVIDTGIGIAADKLAHIFDPFAQADTSTTRRYGGTGLGTTIARQLAELMGGSIAVQSTVGQGSTFTVVLPLPEGAPVAPVAQDELPVLPPLRILAADDVPDNLELLQLCLAPGGHRLTLAHDGQQALEAYRQGDFDLVLMDLQMPVMDGLDAARHIRRWEREHQRPRVPIIALTASVLETDRDSTAEAGMDGFAIKPLETPRLFAEMARVLGHPAPAAVPTRAPTSHMATEWRKGALPVLDWARGLGLWGDAPRLAQGIQRLLDEAAAGWVRWTDVSATPVPPQDLATEMHRLRGMAGNLGLDALRALLEAIEAAVRAEALNRALTLLHELPAALQAVREALAQAYPAAALPAQSPSIAVAAPVALDPAQQAQVRQAIDRLARALSDGEWVQAPTDLLACLLPPAAMAPLAEALEAFDFDRAQACLHALRVQSLGDASETLP